MKKKIALILASLMLFAMPVSVLADESLILFQGDENENQADSDAEEYNDIFVDESAMEDSYDVPDEREKDPGEYVTAPNGYAYTAPRVKDVSPRIFDFAGILTDGEEQSIRADVLKAEESKDCSVLILTSRNVPTDPNYDVIATRDYAADFYDANADNLKDDAFVFIIDMNNRVIYTVGHGKYADSKYVDFHQKVYDAVLDAASDGDYAKVCHIFCKKVYQLENVLYALIPTFWSLVISLIVALIVCGSLVGKHEISKPSRQTVPPVNASNIKHPHHNVIMTGKHHSVRHIPKSKDSGGGGFSGGSFSSGGGGSFSGGGGHF